MKEMRFSDGTTQVKMSFFGSCVDRCGCKLGGPAEQIGRRVPVILSAVDREDWMGLTVVAVVGTLIPARSCDHSAT